MGSGDDEIGNRRGTGAGGEDKGGQRFDPIGRQVSVTARATRVLLDAALASEGATFADWTVLAALNARGPLVQKDLARSLNMIGPSMVERIDRLEKTGLVVRSPLPGDRRASLVSMTDTGRERFAALHDAMRSAEGALTAGIDPGDLEVTQRVLARVTERARWLRAQIPG
jgi:MarR family transcriptional regulator, transcriptional regulator for hemolysin